MPDIIDGPVDCDIHPAVPNIRALLPYLPGHWADVVVQRGVPELDSITYPNNAPLTARPDWREGTGPRDKAASSLERLRAEALDPQGSSIAICNCLYAVELLFNRDMAAAFAQAVNNWMVHEWLDKEPRLRASIIIPLQDPELAVAEIERCAADPRFVQVLMPVFAEATLGKSLYWPIYAAAQKHGLPIGIHAGSMYRFPITSSGWPTYHAEEYIGQAQGFQAALASLVYEGVFQKFPDLKVVLIESGFTWLPACLWRMTKCWHGLRLEVPWVDQSPTQIVRDRVRLTLQPVDAPPTPEQFERFLHHMGSDELLLFSTDYPHWQFDGTGGMPEAMPPSLARKVMFDNPRKTYSRLQETVA